jgi:Ca2+/Na+ antiporter
VNSLFFRLGIVVAIILMIVSLPAREFIKLTVMFGLLFMIFLQLVMNKPKFSVIRILSIIALLGIAGGYVYMLTDLPQRIETKRILIEGDTLVAEGKYQEAINCYQRMEKLGRLDKMNNKIAEAQKEEAAADALLQARELLREGNRAEAIKKLEAIPHNTWVAREAQHLLKDIR